MGAIVIFFALQETPPTHHAVDEHLMTGATQVVHVRIPELSLLEFPTDSPSVVELELLTIQ